MKTHFFIFFLSLFLLCGCAQQTDLSSVRWRLSQTAGFLSSEQGIEQGVSACYAGVMNHKLMIAGGCNFPDVPACEGGKKKFYKGIYVTDLSEDTTLNWKKVGELPLASAYGVSAVYNDRLICVGGTEGTRSLASVISIRLQEDGSSVIIDSLPSLPEPLDNFCGMVVGHHLLLAGGNCKGIPSNVFYCLDLENESAGWVALSSFPGEARTQPVCAGVSLGDDYRFYIWGGFAPAVQAEGKEASLSLDGYCYSSKTQQWTPVAGPIDEVGEKVSLGGGTGVVFQNRWALFTGGVHKDIFLSALQGPAKDYLLHAPEWYRFNNRLFMYDMKRNVWQVLLRSPHLARAGAILVGDEKGIFYNINGELKPGIRTPEITRLQILK